MVSLDKKGFFSLCQVHKLGGKEYYRLGKLPSNAVPALHPSISREHALILHSKAEARCEPGERAGGSRGNYSWGGGGCDLRGVVWEFKLGGINWVEGGGLWFGEG